jgi:3-oxoacyl-[acyl-carrier protein] reductase
VTRPDPDPKLAGRRALVTGAGQGVGRGIAVALAGAGCDVLVNDVDSDRASDAAAEIAAWGGSAAPLPFDVTDHDVVRRAIGGAGAIDILVNNAGNAGSEGFGTIRGFTDTTAADWEPFVRVNLYGVMNCTHAVLPAMTEARWGRVITIVSDAARTGGAQLAAYSAAKAAAAGFTRAIAREVAHCGVTANCISLGTMRTDATAALWDDPDRRPMRDAILADYLVRRPGEPDDAAWLTVTLASPRASWVTGQTIPVNGGYSFAL